MNRQPDNEPDPSETPVCPLCGFIISERDYGIPNADGELSHESCVQEAESEDE